MGATPEEIRNIFQNFRWIDDIPEDQVKRDEICLQGKAALLIEANVDSEMFLNFIRCCKSEHEPWEKETHYLLPEPVSFNWLEKDGYNGTVTQSVTARYFEFGKLNGRGKYWGPAKGKLDSSGRECYICDCKLCDPVYSNNASLKSFATNSPDAHAFENQFYQKYPSLYSICKGISPYAEPEQMCRFWGNTPYPFGRIKVRNMRPDYIWGDIPLGRADGQENWTDARVEQNAFRFLIPCQSPRLPNFALKNRYYEDWYCQVFPFRNQYGETIVNLIKFYDTETQCKCLIPVTTWIRNSYNQSQWFCVPYPAEKTLLYNLDLLLKPECKTVILCDSVELADANQHAIESEEIVFTSFLCSPGKYEQVDWEPLQDKELFILVSNHSGVMLETAALKAKTLRDYFNEELELLPSLAVVPVDYGKRRHRDFNNVDDILKRFQDAKPTVDQDDVRIIETEKEIDELFQNAERKLNELPDKWWKGKDVPPEEQRIGEEQNKKPKPIDYIIRPFLVRGEASMLYAQQKAGKSALAYSIAARVVTQGFSAKPVPLFKGKWWMVPKGSYKVLYLDFENMGKIEGNRQKFQDGYFPESKKQECRADLIIEDMSQAGIDFSAKENHQRVLDMLEDTRKNKGTPNKPVDLLVIDTYTAFVRTETPATPANFKDLINKIRNMNIAVLIVHHANSENEARGLSSKMDPFYLTLKLSCDPDEPSGDLDEQPRILECEYPREALAAKLREPFKMLFDTKSRQWIVFDPEKLGRDENAEFKLIVDGYKKQEFDRDAICQMLGMEKSAYSERLKKAEVMERALQGPRRP